MNTDTTGNKGKIMKIEIAYLCRHTDNWYMMTDSTNILPYASMYSLVIDGQRTFESPSLDKVQIVANRVKHTANLLELSIIA